MKRFLTLIIVLLIVPGLLLMAEEKVRVIKSSKVVTVKGSVRSWDDAVKTQMERKGQAKKMRPVLNFANPRDITQPADTVDPAVRIQSILDPRQPKAISGLSGFAGMTFSANGAGWPPDTCGDIGPNHYVQAVNISIGIYNKSTGAKISTTTFDSFFQGAGISGTPCDEDNNGDPIILYDRYAERWFILDFAWNSTHSTGSWFSIAVSQTSDPTGAWYQYALQADPTLMNDYPKVGVWEDGLYITANMFQFTGSFQGVKVWCLKKPDIYSGTLTALSIFDNCYEAWTILPSNAKGTTAPTTGDPCYMFALDADEYGAPSIDAIYWWKADVNWSTSTFNWIGPYTMTTAAFGLTASGIRQRCGTTLDSLYGRLMHSAIYRKFAAYDSVYLCHVCEGTSRRLMRWYEIRITSGTASIYQQATYSPKDTYSRWMGSIAGDKDGKIAMGYSTGSNKLNAAIRLLDCLTSTEVNVKSAGGCQTTYARWGDYSYMSIDPSDDKTFWYTHEYMAANGTNWQTWICKFQVN